MVHLNNIPFTRQEFPMATVQDSTSSGRTIHPWRYLVPVALATLLVLLGGFLPGSGIFEADSYGFPNGWRMGPWRDLDFDWSTLIVTFLGVWAVLAIIFDGFWAFLDRKAGSHWILRGLLSLLVLTPIALFVVTVFLLSGEDVWSGSEVVDGADNVSSGRPADHPAHPHPNSEKASH